MAKAIEDKWVHSEERSLTIIYPVTSMYLKARRECVINLVGEGGNPELREFYAMKRKEVAKAIADCCR